MTEWWPRAHNLEICTLIGFQILPSLEMFVTDFPGTVKARKLNVRINMDNDWMYCVCRSRN